MTVRLAVCGPARSGKSEAMQLLGKRVPRKFRGDLVTIPWGRDTLLGIDLHPVNLERLSGETVSIRVMAITGVRQEEDTFARLLGRADACLFMLSVETDDDESERDWLEVQESLRAAGRDPESLPTLAFIASDEPSPAYQRGQIAALLGLSRDDVVDGDPRTGRGLFHALRVLIERVLIVPGETVAGYGDMGQGVESGVEDDTAGLFSGGGLSGGEGAVDASAEDADLFIPADELTSRHKGKHPAPPSFSFTDEAEEEGKRGLFGRRKKSKK